MVRCKVNSRIFAQTSTNRGALIFFNKCKIELWFTINHQNMIQKDFNLQIGHAIFSEALLITKRIKTDI